jgi:hypothetical protein
MTRHVAMALVVVLLPDLLAQSAHDQVVSDYMKRRESALFDAGQRHLQLGSWARKAGLIPQATSQFLRAVEVSGGKNQGAVMVLGVMRGYGDAFWRREVKRPSPALLADYERRAAHIELQTRKAHIDLAKRAGKAGLQVEEKEHWLTVLQLGGSIEVDAKGTARIDGERVPEALADWLQGMTIQVNGKQPAFEAAGGAAPKLPDVTEVRSDELVVRTDLPAASAAALHALASAFLPKLRERLAGAPTHPLQLFVFKKRADFLAYLEARGMARFAGGSGVADYGTFQTLVCAEEKTDEQLHALVLHELSHLYFFGTAPAAMPDWFAEGFAESFGGQGTFTWDGETLQLGLPMRRDRIEDLQKAPIPLRELFATDAANLLITDHDKGMRFYAECWALQRFLREDKNPWQARFGYFEAQCRGAVLGAPEGGRKTLDPTASRALCDRLFGPDLEQIDGAFREWLQKL